jgi:hypothetical protein
VCGTCSMDTKTLSLVRYSLCTCICLWYLFYGYGDSLSCVLPLEKERSTFLELLLQLETRVYLLVLE